LLSILAPDQEPVDDRAERIPNWQGVLSFNGDYYVRLSPVRGVTASDYKLNLTLQAPPEPSPTPSPEPSPSPVPTDPQIRTESIDLLPSLPEPRSGQIDPFTVQRYLFNVQAGQTLQVDINEGNVTVDIRLPNGQLLASTSDNQGSSIQQSAPDSGEYQIDVLTNETTDFRITIVRFPAEQE
jgi:serine/threonine-protein kinase